MKKVILLIGILYISMLTLLGSSRIEEINIYDTLVRQQSDIVEQGIKIQYTDKSETPNRVKNNLKLSGEINMYGDNFNYIEKDENYSIEVRGIDSFIEIEVIFLDESVKIENLEELARDKFKDKNDLSVFTYIKGKINDTHSLDFEKISSDKNIKSIESLDIEGGQTGIIKTRNNKEFNYSLMSYDKDNDYIIVGSPVIFISY